MKHFLRNALVVVVCSPPSLSQWSSSQLTLGRQQVGAAATASKFYFAGGCGVAGLTDVIDVYDTTSASWSVLNLSVPRDAVAAVASGDWVFFAGGRLPLSVSSPTVDILHESSGTWQQLNLPIPARYIGAESVGGKVYFFGGVNPVIGGLPFVQILDTTTWAWNVVRLPGAFRGFCSVTTDGRWLCSVNGIGSGINGNDIDVLDLQSGTWRHSIAPADQSVGAVVDGKLYVVSCEGGIEYNRMSVLDLETFAWSSIRRPERRCAPATEVMGPYLLFLNGRDVLAPSGWGALDTADVYNTWSGEWRTMQLTEDLHFRGVASSDAASMVVAGGGTSDGGLNNFSSAVDIFTVDQDIGQVYCSPASNNSTGRPARLLAVGVTSIADNFMCLAAHDAPPGQVGLFLIGTLPVNTPNPAGSPGTLCVGGTFGRLLSHLRVVNSAGILAATIDAQNLPLSPSRSALPGETLRFQACFRDTGPQGPTVNFSDARAITFAP